MRTVFQLKAPTFSGPLEGLYLWSTAGNWTPGLPKDGDSVSFNNSHNFGISADDIPDLSLAALTLQGTKASLYVTASLDVAALHINGDASISVRSDGSDGIDTLTLDKISVTAGVFSKTPSLFAIGAGAVIHDAAASNPAVGYVVRQGGTIDITGKVNKGSTLDFPNGTFKLENPGSTIAARVNDAQAGDVLELPGTKIEDVVFGNNTLEVTTDQGSFDFTDFRTAASLGYTAGFDAASGLAAITFTKLDVFSQVDAAAFGSLKGQYLWSFASNWSAGVPKNGASVAMSASGTDDIAKLKLKSLLIDADTKTTRLTVTSGLTVTELQFGANPTVNKILEANSSGAADVVTIGSVIAPFNFGSPADLLIARGAGAVIKDQGVAEPSLFYGAWLGGEVEIAGALNAGSELSFQHGTFALADPGLDINALVQNVIAGDVLELPGSAVESLFIDPGVPGLAIITTNKGTYTFEHFEAVTHLGYSARFDAATGLEAITFTDPNIFQHKFADAFGQFKGQYVWSNPENWTAGVPQDGASVNLNGKNGTDDIDNLQLSYLQTGNAKLKIAFGLSVTTLDLGLNSVITVKSNAAPDVFTIGSISAPFGLGRPQLVANGAGADIKDNGEAEPGLGYTVENGGLIEIAGAVGVASTLTFAGNGGAIALANPGSTIDADLFVTAGDTLELPGFSVENIAFGAGGQGFRVVTNLGLFDFTNATYAGGIGYTVSIDARTGLQAITFVNKPVVVDAGQTATVAALGDGAAEILQAGAAANATTLNPGGVLVTAPGAIERNAVIDGGVSGVLGTAIGDRVNAGGYELVGFGGITENTVIAQGGFEYALDGGTAANTTIGAGGTLLTGLGGSVTGAVNFAGSDAVLSVAGTDMPLAVIKGFDANGAANDAIILTGFNYAAGKDSATLGAGNVLTLDLNGQTEKLQLDPTQSNAGHHFAVTTNSLDQVVVIDPVTGSKPSMGFLAPATQAGSPQIMQQVLGRSVGLILDYVENNIKAADFLPALKNFAAVTTLDEAGSAAIGASLQSLGLPQPVIALIKEVTAH